MRLHPALPALLALAMAACVRPETTVTPLSKKSYPEKPQGCDIQVVTQVPKDRKYEEIAILNTVATEAQDKDLNGMLPSIKAAACRLGADAVLIKNVEPGSRLMRDSLGKAYTVAIKYLD